MSQLSSHTRLKTLYNKYLYLDERAFHDKVRFFEQNGADIQLMKLVDSVWIESEYLDALFNTGDYEKYCFQSQSFLQKLIFHNISDFRGQNLYQEVLNTRACCFYHLDDYQESIKISQQLLNLSPSRKETRKVLFYSYCSNNVKALNFIKSGLVITLIFTAFMLIFEQVVIVAFYPISSRYFLSMIALISIPVVSFFIIFRLMINLTSWIKTKRWVKQAKTKKSIK